MTTSADSARKSNPIPIPHPISKTVLPLAKLLANLYRDIVEAITDLLELSISGRSPDFNADDLCCSKFVMGSVFLVEKHEYIERNPLQI